jgi:hypothetical protein
LITETFSVRKYTRELSTRGFSLESDIQRNATPAPIPRRCVAYQPMPGDPDQRTGTERWPAER